MTGTTSWGAGAIDAARGVPPRAGAGAGVGEALTTDAAAGVSATDGADTALGGAKLVISTASAPEATKKLIDGLDVDGTLLLLQVDGQELGIAPSMSGLFEISLGLL